MGNQKASALIFSFQEIIRDVTNCGVLNETITPEQEFYLKNCINQIKNTLSRIKVASVPNVDRLSLICCKLNDGVLPKEFKSCISTRTRIYAYLFSNEWEHKATHKGKLYGRYLPVDCSPMDAERLFFGLTIEEYDIIFYRHMANNKLSHRLMIDSISKHIEVNSRHENLKGGKDEK